MPSNFQFHGSLPIGKWGKMRIPRRIFKNWDPTAAGNKGGGFLKTGLQALSGFLGDTPYISEGRLHLVCQPSQWLYGGEDDCSWTYYEDILDFGSARCPGFLLVHPGCSR
jgi:hypothetical protein